MFAYFHIYNEEGTEIFESFDNDIEWRKRPRPKGRYVSTGWIPGNFLAEGILYISTSLRTLNPEVRRFRANDVVAFQIVDNMEGATARVDCAGNIAGVIRPLLKWKTRLDPAVVAD